MNRKQRKKRWKTLVGGVLTVLAGGYGINVAIGPNETTLDVEIQHDHILKYGQKYEMSDQRMVVINLDDVVFYPEGSE